MKKYYIDTLSDETLAEMIDKVLKFENTAKNKKLSWLKIIPAVAAVVLMISLVNLASIFNINSSDYENPGAAVVAEAQTDIFNEYEAMAYQDISYLFGEDEDWAAFVEFYLTGNSKKTQIPVPASPNIHSIKRNSILTGTVDVPELSCKLLLNVFACDFLGCGEDCKIIEIIDVLGDKEYILAALRGSAFGATPEFIFYEYEGVTYADLSYLRNSDIDWVSTVRYLLMEPNPVGYFLTGNLKLIPTNQVRQTPLSNDTGCWHENGTDAYYITGTVDVPELACKVIIKLYRTCINDGKDAHVNCNMIISEGILGEREAVKELVKLNVGKSYQEEIEGVYRGLPEFPNMYAWIRIDALNINYPVVQADDNEYYSDKNIYGHIQYSGSIFADYRNDKNTDNNLNTVIFGHNMSNGTMFGNLAEFGRNREFFDNALIELTTPYGIYIYEVFSAYIENPREPGIYYGEIEFESGEKYAEWLYAVKSLSIFENERTILTADSKIITLKTLANDVGKPYFVVHAVLRYSD